jgi:hypothetical protein
MCKVQNNATPKSFRKNHMCYSYDKTYLELCEVFRNTSLHKMWPHCTLERTCHIQCKFWGLVAVIIQAVVFWIVTPCSLVGGYNTMEPSAPDIMFLWSVLSLYNSARCHSPEQQLEYDTNFWKWLITSSFILMLLYECTEASEPGIVVKHSNIQLRTASVV